MRVNDLHYWLCRNGWAWEYTRGSHRHYRQSATGHKLHFAVHGRELSPQQIAVIMKDLQLLDKNVHKKTKFEKGSLH